MLLQRALHAFEHVRVDIAGAVAKVGGHAALDLRAEHQMALPVDFFHQPAVPGDGDALARGWRVDDGAQLR